MRFKGKPGIVYTARDAAHKRLYTTIERDVPLPLSLHNQILYYAGPTPPRPGMAIGSISPTTGSRMDMYTPLSIERGGLRGMIGKGNRGPQVVAAMKKFKCVYFAATGGAAALLSRYIVQARIVCYEDLKTEAIHELEVRDFPVFVAIDIYGENLYDR